MKERLRFARCTKGQHIACHRVILATGLLLRVGECAWFCRGLRATIPDDWWGELSGT
jgi:hypothetical protein